MWRRIASVIVKDFQQFRRDRLLLIFIFVGPTFQLVMMGQATAADTQHLPTAIIDEDRTSDSRAVVVALDNLQELDVTHYLDSAEEASPLLDRGEVSVAVHLPSGFAAALASPSGRPAVQLIVDGSNIIVVYTALGAAGAKKEDQRLLHTGLAGFGRGLDMIRRGCAFGDALQRDVVA